MPIRACNLIQEPTESSSDTTAQKNGLAGLLPSTVTSPPNPSAASASASSPTSPSGIGALALSLAHLLGSTLGSFADAPSASGGLPLSSQLGGGLCQEST